MRRMRILQLTAGLGVGGAERVVLDLARLLNPTSFEMAIATTTPDCDALSIYGDPGVPVGAFDVRRLGAGGLLGLGRYIRGFRPDIIHAHMFPALFIALVLRGLGGGAPIVFTGHCTTFPRARAAVLRVTRRLRATDIVFVDGQHEELNAPHTVTIRNGVAVGNPPDRAKGEELRFISIGRITDQKDPLGLIDAFNEAAIPHATLTFVGDGPLMPSAQKLVSAYGLQDRVHFLGLRDDVRALLRQADVFLMHSKYEGLPIALLEAGAEAMPIVSTPIGAVPELLAHGRGYLAGRDAYAATLREVASDLPAAFARGQQLHELVKKEYSIEAFAARHAALYTSLRRGEQID